MITSANHYTSNSSSSSSSSSSTAAATGEADEASEDGTAAENGGTDNEEQKLLFMLQEKLKTKMQLSARVKAEKSSEKYHCHVKVKGPDPTKPLFDRDTIKSIEKLANSKEYCSPVYKFKFFNTEKQQMAEMTRQQRKRARAGPVLYDIEVHQP